MKIKFLLPRIIYYWDLSVGDGWVGFFWCNPCKRWEVICAGYGFWDTLNIIGRY